MAGMAEVRPADFARMCGVSPSVICRKIKVKTLVRNAAGLLDTDNSVNKRYLSKRRLRSNADAVVSAGITDEDAGPEEVLKKVDFSTLDDSEIAALAVLPSQALGMTIRELVVRYRGMEGLERHVKMLRDLMSAEEREQRTRERRLQLIEKDFVTSRIFQYLDTLMVQLLEYPESAVDGIVSLIQSKGTEARNDVTARMRSGLTGILKGAKDVIQNELSGLRAKYQAGDDVEEKLEAIAERLDAKD